MHELNLDGLVGPTHHYAGLANGNLASTRNALSLSNPQAAARQGLAKMRLLHQAGIKQALLPPHQRPNLHLLHTLGFSGTAAQQVAKAARSAPALLSACYSAASMWTANAATVSSSSDSQDRRVQFTAANLVSHLHRQQEANFSSYLLQKLFNHPNYFQHHPVLPPSLTTSDEGAANHCRLCPNHAEPGINLFVYGKTSFSRAPYVIGPKKYLARQNLEASQAIARAHQLAPQSVVFACQNPLAIDQGVFHNDVIALANESVLLIHEEALLNQAQALQTLQATAHFPLQIIEIKTSQLAIATAVETYLFNSQLISIPSMHGQAHMSLIAPSECEEHPQVHALIDELIANSNNPINSVHYLPLRQSMHNGGGPACLRLRVPLNTQELLAMHQGILIEDDLLAQLETWVQHHYRDRLHRDDLADPALIEECFTALDELTQLLQLGSIYPFQQESNSCGKLG